MNSKYKFECEVYDKIDDLPNNIQLLISKAQNQLEYAYAPYSQFLVGAAVLLHDGSIHVGCNQENASYPLCMCAERVALYNVGANYKDFKIEAIAITAHNPKKILDEVCMPCGACRQVIQEFEFRQKEKIDIYLTAEKLEIVKVNGIEELLPASFSRDNLI